MERPILLDFPDEILGQRVVLRPFRDEDTQEVHAAIQRSREHIRPWLPWADSHSTAAETLEFIRRTRSEFIARQNFGLGMFAGDDGHFLGGSGLHPGSWHVPSFEIGYWIRKEEEGNGYVTEAVKLLTSLAFERLDAQRVMIRLDPRNARSKAIPERLGYVFEGRMRNAERHPSGEAIDMLIYSMIPEDYRRRRW